MVNKLEAKAKTWSIGSGMHSDTFWVSVVLANLWAGN